MNSLNYKYAIIGEEQSHDDNSVYERTKMLPYVDPKIKMNGTEREAVFTPKNAWSFNQFSAYHKDGQKILPNNHFDKHFYTDRVGPGDVYSYYAFQEVPLGGYQPRSRANCGEYHQSINNKYFYRRENAYELQNNVIHPTHYMEISPERLAADPNQAIYNYLKGTPEPSDRETARVMEFSRLRTNARRNRRKVKQQIMYAYEDGNAFAADELDPMHW